MDSSESIPGLHKRFQIRAQADRVENRERKIERGRESPRLALLAGEGGSGYVTVAMSRQDV